MRDPQLMDAGEFLIQKDLEQFSWQQFPGYEIARSLVLFDELLPQVFSAKSTVFKFDPDEAIRKATGLSIREHLVMGMCVCAQVLTHSPVIRPSHLYNASIPSLETLLTPEKVDAYLRFISGDYDELRDLDQKRNNADPWYTKHRFNPLQEKPLVRLERLSQEEREDVYVAPNFHLLMRRALPGVYWSIHNVLEADGGKHHSFSTGFGYVFEEYVGEILKRIDQKTFNISNVQYQCFDWIVPSEKGFILVDAKAEHFNLLSRTYPEKEQMIRQEIMPKIIEALVQCNRRLSDIAIKPELSLLRDKPVIPCVVVWDVPLVEQGGMDKFIEAVLDRILQGQEDEAVKAMLSRRNIQIHEIEALRKKRPALISIRELELLEGEGGKVPLWDFVEKKMIPGSGGRMIMTVNAPDIPLTCPYLDGKYKSHWDAVNDGSWIQGSDKS